MELGGCPGGDKEAPCGGARTNDYISSMLLQLAGIKATRDVIWGYACLPPIPALVRCCRMARFLLPRVV